jgi:hypothetical protein
MATEAQPAASTAGHPQPHTGPRIGLALAALGIVFGDIGTSPLYALQTVFSADHNAVEASRSDVFGVVSMVFWSITIVVCYGYAFLMLRAFRTLRGTVGCAERGRPRPSLSSVQRGPAGVTWTGSHMTSGQARPS